MDSEAEDNDNPPGADCSLFIGQYSIVKAILENLPIRDLLSASQVCSTWSEIGRVVRTHRRNRASVILYHPYGEFHDQVFEFFNDHQVTQPVKDFMSTIHNLGDFHFPSVQELVTEKNYENLFPKMREEVVKQFMEMYSEAQMIVIASTAGVDEYMTWDEDNITKLRLILSEIPNRMPCFATFSYGIACSVQKQNENDSETKSYEMENSDIPMIAALMVPKVQGFRVKMFAITKKSNDQYVKKKMDSKLSKEILGIKPGDDVKGIVLFYSDIRKAKCLRDAAYQYLKDNPHVALGGGAHYKNASTLCDEESPVAGGLIICGGENVRVASVGLFDTKISKKNEDKIIEMKGCEFSDGDSFAFMFACNGRGAHMHGKINVESSLFRKHLPRTPLIGTFTGGEYCHEVVPTRAETSPPPKKLTSLEFAFTTVFVFVSYKYPQKKK